MPKIPPSEMILNADGSVYHLNLLPKNIADTIITVGDPGRVHKVSQYFDRVVFEMNKREFITHTGYYKGKKMTVISSGMGTDNVEILMTELDMLANINLKKREVKSRKKKLKIVRVGTSGGLQEDLPLGSLLASDYGIGIDTLMAFYDLKMTEKEQQIADGVQADTGLPFPPYCVQGSQMLLDLFRDELRVGNTVTCPGFYGPQGRHVRIKPKLDKFINKLACFHLDGTWLTNFEMETAGYYAMGRLLGHEVLSTNAIIANRITNGFAENGDKIIDDLIRTVLDKLVEVS